MPYYLPAWHCKIYFFVIPVAGGPGPAVAMALAFVAAYYEEAVVEYTTGVVFNVFEKLATCLQRSFNESGLMNRIHEGGGWVSGQRTSTGIFEFKTDCIITSCRVVSSSQLSLKVLPLQHVVLSLWLLSSSA